MKRGFSLKGVKTLLTAFALLFGLFLTADVQAQSIGQDDTYNTAGLSWYASNQALNILQQEISDLEAVIQGATNQNQGLVVTKHRHWLYTMVAEEIQAGVVVPNALVNGFNKMTAVLQPDTPGGPLSDVELKTIFTDAKELLTQ